MLTEDEQKLKAQEMDRQREVAELVTKLLRRIMVSVCAHMRCD